MSEPSDPVPEEPPVAESRLKRAVRTVGGGLGCLALLAGLAIVAFIALAYFFDNPAFWIAVVALVVAGAALKNSKRSR